MNRIFKIEKIYNSICDYYQTQKDDLKTPNRQKHIITAKRMFCYLSCEYTNETFYAIGKFLNIDHATVMYHNNKIKVEKEIYRETRLDIENIISKLFLIDIVVQDVDLLKIAENYTQAFK